MARDRLNAKFGLEFLQVADGAAGYSMTYGSVSGGNISNAFGVDQLNQPFSTYDHDVDTSSDNCAELYKGCVMYCRNSQNRQEKKPQQQ